MSKLRTEKVNIIEFVEMYEKYTKGCKKLLKRYKMTQS